MSKQNKSPLGRGIEALISMDDLKINGSSSINEIELSKIHPNPDQPRSVFDQEALEELAASIRSFGLVQPITLREIRPDHYQIISGERRYKASLMAGLTAIPAYIRTIEDENVMEIALIENIQREDLNPIEIALAFQNLIETYSLTQDKLSERIGKKRATISNFLRLLKLPAEIQMGLKDKKIDMGHAKALLGLEDMSTQLMVYEQILLYGFSVRKTEEIIRTLNEETPNNKPSGRTKKQTPPEYKLLKEHLTRFFGSNVLFSCDENMKGKITIPFQSEKDLERIVRVFDALKS